MNRQQISATLDDFLRLQGLCVIPLIAVWAIFWAIDRTVNLPVVVTYVLIQVNLTFLLLKPLEFLHSGSKAAYRWPAYVALLFAISAFVVTMASEAAFWLNGGRGAFAAYLKSGWKFPFVGNALFWIGYEIYRVTKCRLESRNRSLQRTLEIATAERKHETEELEQALEIQRGLLPKEIPQLPEFEITGSWQPAKVVGGDYYDIIQLSPDKLAICIADVSGKGVSAALLMANVQAAVRAFSSEAASPSNVCSKINSVLCTNIARDKFVTLFYGVLDAASRKLRYTNAGHLQPILIVENGHVTHLENSGALLGVFPTWKYEDSSVQLSPGDLLLLFTDGITEAMASDGREFGEEHLIRIATSFSVEPLSDLQRGQVKCFCNSQMSDDATLLLIAALRGKPKQTNLAQNDTIESEELIHFAGARS